MSERFSRRHGYEAHDSEIRVREDAPEELRSVLVDIAYESGLRPGELRSIICRVLRIAADPDNWSEFPNIDYEVRSELMNCEWYRVYDVIEEIPGALSDGYPDEFEEEMNKYFHMKGIGWQLFDGRIEVRGPEAFEVAVEGALNTLRQDKRSTAHTELLEALKDLSRRPVSDTTGAIQHSMAALECVARDITGNPNATLGKIINDNPDLIPKPLDQAVEKAWGYASETGRHLREGESPKYAEAELIVSMSSAVSSYLINKVSD